MKFIGLIPLIALAGCIGEDLVFDEVDPELRVTNPIASMELGSTYQFEYIFLDNVGMETMPENVVWESSDNQLLTIDQSGLATAHQNGIVVVNAMASNNELMAETSLTFEISGDATMLLVTDRVGSMSPASSYGLRGSFRMFEDGDDLVLAFDDSYNFDGAPGPYLYLTNNPNSLPTSEAYEIGPVSVRSGAHEYLIPLSDVTLNQYNTVYYYCKPFTVRLGFGMFDE